MAQEIQLFFEQQIYIYATSWIILNRLVHLEYLKTTFIHEAFIFTFRIYTNISKECIIGQEYLGIIRHSLQYYDFITSVALLL